MANSFSQYRNVTSVSEGIDPSISDVLGAAFQRETQIGSFFSSEVNQIFEPYGEKNALERVSSSDIEALGEKYRPYAESFAGLNRSQIAAKKRDIDREIENKHILDMASGWRSFGATVAVQAFDPVSYVPFGGQALKGASLGTKLRRGATAGAVGTALQEPVLQATQEDRSASEGALNLGASVIFGMALGGAVHAFDGRTRAALNDIEKKGFIPTTASEPVGKDLSAAIVPPITADDLKNPSRAQQKLLNSSFGWLQPVVAVQKSKSTVAKHVGAELSENFLQFQGVDEGRIGVAVESLAKVKSDTLTVSHRKAMKEGFSEYLKETNGPGFANVPGRVRADREFSNRVAFALRRGDQDGDSAAVTKAARSIREQVLDPLLRQAQSTGLLPEGITTKTALSYLTRSYNRTALSARQGEFQDILARHFSAGMRGGGFDPDEMAAALAKKRETSAKQDFTDATDEEIDFFANEAAQSVWQTLMGLDGGFENSIVAAVQGPLKGRTLLIPDELIEDFLNNDAYEVVGQYIRTMSAEIELKKRYGRADMRDQIRAINDDFDSLKEGKSEKEARKLDRERENAIKSIEAMRDRIRGTYMAKENGGTLASVARAANSFNFVRLLGDVTTSSLPDMFRLAQVHGLENLLGPSGMKAISKSLSNFKKSDAAKFMKDEPELAGISEIFLNSRVQAMADLGDPHAQNGPIETVMRSMANIGSLASGINHWNQHWKQVGWQFGVQRFDRIARAGYENAKPKDRKWLRTLKISRADMDRIGAQLKKHGKNHSGLIDANSAMWTDANAVEIYRAALRADVDSIIVTPGAGDKPLFADHPLGAMAFQFKSFFAATHSRALVRGLGEDQTSFLTGAATMVAMGAAVYQLKALSGNFETSDNVGVWLAEGLDRSGVLAIPMEINNMVEPFLNQNELGGVYTGLSALMGDSAELSSRYRFRRDSVGELFLGPSLGLLSDGQRIAGDTISQLRGGNGIDDGTVGSAARLLPFANHPGVKQWMRYFAIPEAKEALR